MIGSAAHLHPAVREVALAGDEARLQAVRARRWVSHHPAERVLALLQEAFDQPPGDRMENLLLLAESGMGKTMLLRKFQRDHALPADPATGVQPWPVVHVLMAEQPSERAFLVQVLKAIGAPVVLALRQPVVALREEVSRILREVGARMLVIDEVNSVLVGSALQQRGFLQLLRFLSNELGVAIVCAGVPESRFALRSDPQLRNRMTDVSLDPWEPGAELQAFVTLLVQCLPLRDPSPVESAKLCRLLAERSGGITLPICRALERAAAAAIRSGRERIDLAAVQDPEVWRGMWPANAEAGRLRPSALVGA